MGQLDTIIILPSPFSMASDSTKPFFLDWKPEVKFFFIFGCLIAVVLPIAGAIRARNDRRTAKHTLVCDEERGVESEMAQATTTEEENPFGILAMEEDLDVDGLWNSQTSTSLHTPLGSPVIGSGSLDAFRNALAKISHSRRASSTSSVSRLKLPEPRTVTPIHNRGNLSGVNKNAALPMNTSQDHAHSQVALTTPHSSDARPSRDSSLDSDLLRWTQEHPHLTTRFNSVSKTKRTIIIGNTLHESTSVTHSIDASSSLQNLKVLDRMEAHRRFHAAESGQLPSRTRRAIRSDIPNPFCDGRSDFEDHHTDNQRSTSWPITDHEVIIKMTVPHSKPQRRVSPHVVPFRAFVEMHPPPKTCPSAWTEKTQNLVEDKLTADKDTTHFTIAHPSRGRSFSTPLVAVSPGPSSEFKTTTFCNRAARKVNIGFEVLPAGTLEQPTLVKDLGDQRDVTQIEYDQFKKRAKLQKRNRLQTRSDTSSQERIVYYRDTLHSPLSSTVY